MKIKIDFKKILEKLLKELLKKVQENDTTNKSDKDK